MVTLAAQLLAWWDAGVREVGLFAAVLFLIGGIDDLAIDAVYLWLRWRGRGLPERTIADLGGTTIPKRYAIFVPAWDEQGVIARMLDHLLATLDHPAFAVFVGTYPNDPATIAAVRAVADRDARVRLAVGTRAGPTTKADCLNSLWRAVQREEAAGRRFDAIVLHDAEDVVHPAELRVFDALIGGCVAVQLPVLPLADPHSPLIAGHYLDEFAESHGKTLLVRQALGAALPLAGVGCAIRMDALAALADRRDGLPFDAASLTEDYELGLEVAPGCLAPGCLAHVRERPGGQLVAVRALFPGELNAAVRQKARWMTGIALAGWDRVGWRSGSGWREHWMRMRDRRAPLAVIVLLAAYAALLAWGASLALHWFAGTPMPRPSPFLGLVFAANGVILSWRFLMRAIFTHAAYGWREALLSVPRVLVGNAIALLAARRAATLYWRMLRGGDPQWDKTAHAFPDLPAMGT